MTTLFVKHNVEDFDHWKKFYDEFSAVRKEAGVVGASVHQDLNNPNTVIVTHLFKDANAATAMINSEELKSAMAKAGVSGKPEIWLGGVVENTPY